MRPATLVIVAVLATRAHAEGPTRPPARTVTVCLEAGALGVPPIYFFSSPEAASRIFSPIGIRLNWRSREDCQAQPGGIRIRFSGAVPPELARDALAYSLPFEGTQIVVFWRRVQQLQCRCAKERLLGYVIAHEIAHLLRGNNSHSSSGIMKARWEPGDFDQMMTTKFTFAPDDVHWIQLGLARRTAEAASRLAAGLAGQ
jgi:hypothetical protein